MVSTWPGIKHLRELLGIHREQDGRQRLNLTLDLAEMGSSERVQQLKLLEREFQRMLEEAADAYKASFRPREGRPPSAEE